MGDNRHCGIRVLFHDLTKSRTGAADRIVKTLAAGRAMRGKLIGRQRAKVRNFRERLAVPFAEVLLPQPRVQINLSTGPERRRGLTAAPRRAAHPPRDPAQQFTQRDDPWLAVDPRGHIDAPV